MQRASLITQRAYPSSLPPLSKEAREREKVYVEPRHQMEKDALSVSTARAPATFTRASCAKCLCVCLARKKIRVTC